MAESSNAVSDQRWPFRKNAVILATMWTMAVGTAVIAYTFLGHDTLGVAVSYGLLWLLGLSIVGLAARMMRHPSGELRQTEQLRESERRFRAIFDQTFQFIGLMATDGTLIEANRTALGFLGLEASQVLGKHFWETAWWTHSSALQDELRAAISKAAAGELARFEAFHPAPDGIPYADVSIKPVKDEAGSVVLLIPEGRDITERRRAEEAMLAEKRFSEAALNSLPGLFYVLDAQGSLLRWNHNLERVSGYSADEIAAMSALDFFAPQDRDPITATIQRVFQHGSGTVENELLTKGGEKLPHYFTGLRTTIGNETCLIGMGIDIADRRHAEEALRRAHDELEQRVEQRTAQLAASNRELALFRQFVETSREGMGWVDLEGHIRYANSALCHMLGEDKPEPVYGKPVSTYYSEETSRQFFAEVFPTVLAEGTWTGELIIHSAKGEQLPTKNSVFALRDEQDNPLCYANVITDLTERKRNEDELKRHRDNLEELVVQRTRNLSEINEALQQEIAERKLAEQQLQQLRNYLSNIIDSMPSVLIGVDHECQVTQWNRRAEQTTGIAAAAATGRALQEVFPRLAAQIDRVQSAMRSGEVSAHTRLTYVQGGETCYEDLTIYPLITNRVEGAVLRLDDVTQRVRLEDMMVQSEKMLSVGGLAAGMAHEINNPLAGIMQSAEVLQRRLTEDLPANQAAARAIGIDLSQLVRYLQARGLDEMLDNIRESGRRAAAIVRNMLSFARKGEQVTSTHDLCQLLDQTVELARTDYDLKKKYDFRTIQIQREYDPSLPSISCHGSRIQQVFLNILKNAAEAMGERTADAQTPSRLILRVRRDGDMVRVEIEDNGPGIDESLRKRVFEPFFTTKAVGKGTGLGLSVSYFIVTENHGGELTVEPAPIQGARFVIRLPTVRKEA